MRISVDGSRIRNSKVAFSNLSGIVWTGPEIYYSETSLHNFEERSYLDLRIVKIVQKWRKKTK